MGAAVSQLADFGRGWIPGGTSHLNPNQKHINRQFQMAFVTSAAWCYLGYNYAPISVPVLNNMVDRLAYALQWQVPSVATMAVGVFQVGGTRWCTEAINPLQACQSQADKDRFEIHRNYLSNTTEQLILSVTSQLILSTFLSQSQMRIIPVLATLFVTGRVLFWCGYLNRPTDRVLGFGMTFIPNMVLLAYCCYRFATTRLTSV